MAPVCTSMYMQYTVLLGPHPPSQTVTRLPRPFFQNPRSLPTHGQTDRTIKRGTRPVRMGRLRPHSTTPTSSRGSSRGCRRVGRLPRSACHRNNFRKSRVSDVRMQVCQASWCWCRCRSRCRGMWPLCHRPTLLNDTVEIHRVRRKTVPLYFWFYNFAKCWSILYFFTVKFRINFC